MPNMCRYAKGLDKAVQGSYARLYPKRVANSVTGSFREISYPLHPYYLIIVCRLKSHVIRRRQKLVSFPCGSVSYWTRKLS